MNVLALPKKVMAPSLQKLAKFVSNLDRFDKFLQKKQSEMIPKTVKNSFLIKHKGHESIEDILKPIDKQVKHKKSKSFALSDEQLLSKVNFHKIKQSSGLDSTQSQKKFESGVLDLDE